MGNACTIMYIVNTYVPNRKFAYTYIHYIPGYRMHRTIMYIVNTYIIENSLIHTLHTRVLEPLKGPSVAGADKF